MTKVHVTFFSVKSEIFLYFFKYFQLQHCHDCWCFLLRTIHFMTFISPSYNSYSPDDSWWLGVTIWEFHPLSQCRISPLWLEMSEMPRKNYISQFTWCMSHDMKLYLVSNKMWKLLSSASFFLGLCPCDRETQKWIPASGRHPIRGPLFSRQCVR